MINYITFDTLYDFFTRENKSFTFKTDGQDKLVVSVPVDSISRFDDAYEPKDGLLKVHLKSCHLSRNRNGSSISEESMNQAIPSFYNRPILGYIHQLDDGSYDFAGHEFYVDDDGNYVYQEIPLGVIPESCNPKLVYDEEKDKTYLEVDGYIYEDYSRAADILREKEESKVSIEIAVDEMSYSATEKVLNIDKFHFLGVTILGKTTDGTERTIEEGMYGSNITVAKFDSNAVLEMLEQMNSKIEALSNFTINTTHGKEETGLDNEKIVNEEAEVVTEEKVVAEEETEVKEVEAEVGEDEDPEEDDEVLENESMEQIFAINYKNGKNLVIQELSHDDIRYALYNLIEQYNDMDNDLYWIEDVYNDHFVMASWNGQLYGQKYSVDGDNVSLDGERYKLYRELLTETEKAELDSMRANYSAIKEQLDKYVAAEDKAKKEDIVNSECYDCIRESKEFEEIVKSVDTFSVDEVLGKCDALLLSYTKNRTFSAESHKTVRKVHVNAPKAETHSPYGNLFENYNKK